MNVNSEATKKSELISTKEVWAREVASLQVFQQRNLLSFFKFFWPMRDRILSDTRKPLDIVNDHHTDNVAEPYKGLPYTIGYVCLKILISLLLWTLAFRWISFPLKGDLLSGFDASNSVVAYCSSLHLLVKS